MAYLPGATSRIRVKVVGRLSADSYQMTMPASDEAPGSYSQGQAAADAEPDAGLAQALEGREAEPSTAELASWQKRRNSAGEWIIDGPDLHLIAIGTGILGAGGGGSPHRGRLKATLQLQR